MNEHSSEYDAKNPQSYLCPKAAVHGLSDAPTVSSMHDWACASPNLEAWRHTSRILALRPVRRVGGLVQARLAAGALMVGTTIWRTHVSDTIVLADSCAV